MTDAPILVQRWPVAAVVPGDVIWSDKHGDWLTVERIECEIIDLHFYGPGEVIGIVHDAENIVLRRLPNRRTEGAS